MFETLKNAFGTKEIRIKIFATLALILVYRLGCYVPVPGIDPANLTQSTSDFAGMLAAITGGSMSNGTLFALGIIPFINAFIIMQLLTLIIPKLEKLSKEGESGRAKITQITRFFALALAAVQGVGIALSWNKADAILPTFGQVWVTIVFVVVILMAGSVMVMWLGERITEYGIGNGTSIIIFIGILSTAGSAILNSFDTIAENGDLAWNLIGFLLLVLAIFAFIVYIDLAERKITVQYAKQVKGNKMYGGQTTHIPIRINASGVMPIIFATSFLSFPSMIITLLGLQEKSGAITYFKYFTAQYENPLGMTVYYVAMIALIIFFAYFYAQIQFNPEDVSRNIQQYGGFIPGIRPGKPTSDYLMRINNRITLFGAIFLAVVAVIPTFLFNLIGEDLQLSSAFSATGLLIVVSVALEINKQLESQIMMRHYKGFLK
jgi:preprotein translocase subunit SecY